MAGVYTVSNVTLTTGSEMTAAVANALASAGWLNTSGSTWTKTVGSRVLTVDVGSASWLSAHQSMTLNGQTCYFPVYAFVVGANLQYMISISDDFFYLRIQGPIQGATGAQDATLGSGRAFAMITTINPADTSDTDTDGLQAVVRSHSSTNVFASTASVIQKRGPSGIANAAAELMTTRPAIQDVSLVGDLPPSIRSGSGYFGSRYAVVDSSLGLRGTLNNVAFASESYVLTGDDSAQQYGIGTEWVRGGIRYVVDAACGYPSSGGVVSYSPLGLATPTSNVANNSSAPNASGPRIFVKKGDGI